MDEFRQVISDVVAFSALQRAENSSISIRFLAFTSTAKRFSALQRAENSSICRFASYRRSLFPSFSALQRAENSSMQATIPRPIRSLEFQCSSASRKFLNSRGGSRGGSRSRFQCSSASRKFLNPPHRPVARCRRRSFSALQRAENSSIPTLSPSPSASSPSGFSALQRAENSSISANSSTFTVLALGFSALQRAENSSIRDVDRVSTGRVSFSALQRAENSSISAPRQPKPFYS